MGVNLAFDSFTVGISMLPLRLLLYYFHCLSMTTLLHWPPRMLRSLFSHHDNFFDYLFWNSVTLVQYTLSMLYVLIRLELIRVSFLLPPLFEGALGYQNLLNFIVFCSWCLCQFTVDLWVSWFLLDCFHLDQCVHVLGLRPGAFVLPCSVHWISIARMTFYRVSSGVISSANLLCNHHSMLLSLAAAIVLICCAQMHVCIGRLSVGIPLIIAVWVKLILSCGWLLTYMMRFLSSPITAWVTVPEFWGLSLFWLSLPLVRLLALWQEPLWSRFCWQLPAFQIGRDEVTEMTLLVDELSLIHI